MDFLANELPDSYDFF